MVFDVILVPPFPVTLKVEGGVDVKRYKYTVAVELAGLFVML
jgi:hypothetical protein